MQAEFKILIVTQSLAVHAISVTQVITSFFTEKEALNAMEVVNQTILQTTGGSYGRYSKIAIPLFKQN